MSEKTLHGLVHGVRHTDAELAKKSIQKIVQIADTIGEGRAYVILDKLNAMEELLYKVIDSKDEIW